MSDNEIFVIVSQGKHVKAIVTICCSFSLIPLWALVRYVNVCHTLMLRDTSPSSDWGQRQLNGVFSHLCSSHHFVSLWPWASSQCIPGSHRYWLNTGSRIGVKPIGLSLESGLAVGRARRDQDFHFKSLKKEERKSEGMCECVGANTLRWTALFTLWSIFTPRE